MNCRSGKTASGCCGGKGKDKCRTLKEVVAHYEEHFEECADSEWQYFADLEIDECIERAPRGVIKKTGKENCHPHQYRIKKVAAENFRERLEKKREELTRASDFETLFELIETEGKGIQGIGPLAIYDTAHRIGRCLRRWPEKVYLHAGTEIGARKLLKNRCTKGAKTLDKKDFPKELQKFTPAHIENILCIYKNSIAFK